MFRRLDWLGRNIIVDVVRLYVRKQFVQLLKLICWNPARVLLNIRSRFLDAGAPRKQIKVRNILPRIERFGWSGVRMVILQRPRRMPIHVAQIDDDGVHFLGVRHAFEISFKSDDPS